MSEDFEINAETVLTMISWDPNVEDGPIKPLLPSASIRIRKDLMSMYKDPPPGIFVTASETDIRNIHAIIVGPMDTPYEGGMFYFFLRCPHDFPIQPPKVRFMTTDAGRVRFNPNLYSCGKVCLSIIGTWNGPGWTPAQQLSSLLISIQSLLNDNPLTNEPGYEKTFRPEEQTEYSEMITHENIRVAVLGMVENECHLNIPQELVAVIERTFMEYFDCYVDLCKRKLHLDSRCYKDPLNSKAKVRYQYKNLLERLHKLKEKITIKQKATRQPSSDGDGSDYKDDEEEDKIDEANVHEYIVSSSSSSSSEEAELLRKRLDDLYDAQSSDSD